MAPLSCVSFSDFPDIWRPWQFWGALVKSLFLLRPFLSCIVIFLYNGLLLRQMYTVLKENSPWFYIPSKFLLHCSALFSAIFLTKSFWGHSVPFLFLTCPFSSHSIHFVPLKHCSCQGHKRPLYYAIFKKVIYQLSNLTNQNHMVGQIIAT